MHLSHHVFCQPNTFLLKKEAKPPKLDFTRIRHFRWDVDPHDVDESDDDDNEDPDRCGMSTLGVDDEDPWDADINLDSQLLLSIVNDSTDASPTTEADVHALEEPSKPAEIGEWSDIEF